MILLTGITNDFGYINARWISGAQAEAGAVSLQADITIDSPFTLSRNPLLQVAGIPGYLNLELIRGTYLEDWNALSATGGRSWSGDFRLSITGEDGVLLHTFPLSDQYNEELQFNDLFQIEFGDYNGDGNPDFTIGQYGSSNGNFYRLFAISKDCSIQELAVERTPELFISSTDRYSVKLTETAEGFTASHYDNSTGRLAVHTYRWDGAVFQRVQ
ncbi:MULTISPECIES: hypothetical protein [unclassified Paenibacillus]|nr:MULTISPECIES: hypothetical protein [unclassified Paenibacillus]